LVELYTQSRPRQQWQGEPRNSKTPVLVTRTAEDF
jgi:hypothetical protein